MAGFAIIFCLVQRVTVELGVLKYHRQHLDVRFERSMHIFH
jgi:hypothetical protein